MFSANVLNRFQLSVSTFFLIAFCLSTNIFAQNTASLNGLVKDQNEAVIAGATVKAVNTASSRETTTTTDRNGKYEFNNLSPGPYRILVRKSGFSDASEGFSIDGGESATRDFSLGLGSLEAEVTVTAARGLRATSEIPQTVTVVSETEIAERRPIGISQAFERAPSVLSTDPNPFRARPQIRGLQSNRILVTVDGERLNNPRFGADFVGVSPSLIDTSQVSSVEVVAGSGSSLYGSDAVGGTINIVTKGPSRELDGTRIDFRFDGDYGSNNDYRKGAVNFGIGSKFAAARFNFGRFISPSYRLGNEAVSRNEVITFGRFAAAAGNFAGQSIISAYPVYEITPGQEVPNTQGRGYFGSADVILFPNDRQDFRIRFQDNNYRDLGVPFTTPPFSTNRPVTGLSNFGKFSLRYEIREITDWFPRISASFYRQEYRRTLDEIRSNINTGSSFASSGPPAFTNVFTGNLSTFTRAGDSKTVNSNNGTGFDVQLNFLPVKNLIYITGVNFSNDFSHDDFATRTFNAAGVITSSVSGVRNTPDTNYRNIGWYNQLEYNAHKYVRLTGGFRFDNWKTEARPTNGFPNGVIGQVFLRTLPLIQANPGPLDFAGANGYADLANGNSVKTNSNVVTYNVGATFFVPGGINPYVRYSTSFREPDLLGRYLFRNFTTAPFFSLPSVVNTNLKPEKGRDIDVGVKIARRQYRGSFSYYRNQLNDATGTVLNAYCISPFGIPGIVPTPNGFGCPTSPPNPPTHLVQVFQTVNFSTVLIRGFEATGEADVALGDFGSLTPFFSFSTIKATNQNPDANRVAIIRNLYNSSAPLELDGAIDDVPFYSLPNYQGTFAPRFTGAKGRFWVEYEYRFTSKVTRVDPQEISFAGTTTYANFASFKGLQKHSIRGGFKMGGDNFPMNVTLGVENLTDNLYFQLFQPAPAPGRSFTIGTTINLSKVFNK